MERKYLYDMERLQKILSNAGIASRRRAEELITGGHVIVDGKVVKTLGAKANPATAKIEVLGKLVDTSAQHAYYVLHKPRGVVSTTSDPQGRMTVTQLLGRMGTNVYPVGRLDYYSEGLLLLTNDGEFANKILSAKSGMPKTYLVKLTRFLRPDELTQFRMGGMVLDGRPVAAAGIRLYRRGANPWYEVTLLEGRNNQIRRMAQRLGTLVEKIKRVAIGPLDLGTLQPGEFRKLSFPELKEFRRWFRSPPKTTEEFLAEANTGKRVSRGPKGRESGRRSPKRAVAAPGKDVAAVERVQRGEQESARPSGEGPKRPARKVARPQSDTGRPRRAAAPKRAQGGARRSTAGPSRPSGGPRKTGPGGPKRGPAGPGRGRAASKRPSGGRLTPRGPKRGR